MRVVSVRAVAAATVAMAAVIATELSLAAVALAKDDVTDAELDRSSDDLIVRFGGWDACDGWLAAHRHVLLPGTRRATPVAAGAKRAEDAAARGRARDALLAALGSRDPAVASEAVLALGFAGDARDIPALAKIVREGTESRRMTRWAALGLGLLPLGDAAQSDEARKALLTGLEASIGKRDRFACFWAFCGYALAMRGDGAAAPTLAELHDKAAATRTAVNWTHDEVTGSICIALGALAGEDGVPEFEEDLKPRTRQSEIVGDASWTAVAGLARAGGARSVDLLRKAAADPREHVRCLALQSLGVATGAKDDATAKLLRDALVKDRDASCRQMAAIGLARSGHPSASAALAAVLERGEALDRRFFAIALALSLRNAPDPKLSELLAKTLARTGSQEERAALAIACGLAGVQTARADIVDSVSKSRTGFPASSACFALRLLGAAPGDRKILHEVLAQSVDPTARREAALALGVLRDHSVVDELKAILLDTKATDSDRGSAAMCLGHVGDDADIDVMVGVVTARATTDPLRACVIHGLGRLLDRDECARLSKLVTNGRWLPLAVWIDPMADPRALLE